MKSRTHSRLHSPIALRVAALNRYILAKRGKAKKAVQYNYIDDLLKQCCGYVIKCDRIYISNRVVRAVRRLVEVYSERTDSKSEAELARRLNSYLGIMSHTRSFNIQKRIMNDVLTTHKTLYFFRRDGHIVCAQKRKYMPKYSAIQNIQKFKNEICGLQARSCHIRMRRRACRRVENNSNKQDYVLGKIWK